MKKGTVFVVLFAGILTVAFAFGPNCRAALAQQQAKLMKGTVLAVNESFLGFRGTIMVESSKKQYTIHYGARTRFNPDRLPLAGETVTVSYIVDRGVYKAYSVNIHVGGSS